ncbi:MAG TPA: ATP-binding cassette domain-containing protein [Candidatus Bathyarchaeia archaeon]|jgi:ABC-type multidrug transport system ATPase subunit|nr:ATP-binding cassette domain-containing protein [Candidatus Bathyarchaeia archaeon]
MTNVIEAKSIVVEYPSVQGVLRLYDQGVSLRVEHGDFLAVLGGSGWGKSTLVNVILGLEKPFHGSVHFLDHDVTRESFVKRCSLIKTAAVFQRPTALPQMTVSQNLHLALSLAGVPRKERDERIKEALAFFGLEKIEGSHPDGLSAGQRRRVDLARALAIKPELLVIDEPTGDLDGSATNLLIPLLRGLNRNQGTTIFMTTALPRQASQARHQVHLRPPTYLTPEHRVVGD